MSLSETRFGTNALGSPEPVPLPPLTAAFSRRAALFGAVTVAGISTGALPGPAVAGALTTNDARLVAIPAELRATFDAAENLSKAHPQAEDLPEWNALIGRFAPSKRRWPTRRATPWRACSKARGSQVPCVETCVNGIAVDLVRLFGGRHA